MRMVGEKKRIAGLRAKRMGATWENLFESSAWRAGCAVIKIPSGCRWVSAIKAVPVRTPFDFVIIKGGKSVFIDTKSSLGKTFTCSDCDPHQIHWLSECAKAGARAGYVVEFRNLNVVVFFDVLKLSGLKARQSLKPEDGLKLSGDDDRLDLKGLFYERREEVATSVGGAGDGSTGVY